MRKAAQLKERRRLNPEPFRAQQRAFYKKHIDKRRLFNRTSRLKRYGINEEIYNSILKLQQGLCKICGKPSGTKKLHVDHDHITKVVRGLLCLRCNTDLAVLEDTEFRVKAEVYLKSQCVVNGKHYGK